MRLGCRVFSRPNNTYLNVNKSYAMEQASGDWVFYVDPDERHSRKCWLMEIEKVHFENTDKLSFQTQSAVIITLDTGYVTEVNIRTHSYVYSREVLPASLTNMYMKN